MPQSWQPSVVIQVAQIPPKKVHCHLSILFEYPFNSLPASLVLSPLAFVLREFMLQGIAGPGISRRQHYESKHDVNLIGDDHGEQWVRTDQSSNASFAHASHSAGKPCSRDEIRKEDGLDK